MRSLSTASWATFDIYLISIFSNSSLFSSEIFTPCKKNTCDIEKFDINIVNNNVILANSNQDKLNADHLIWDRESNQIYSDGFVTITTDKQVIMGYGFISDERFEKYTLSNITGTIYL